MSVFSRLRAADGFTVLNAALGFLAITYIADRNYARAEALILLAVLADGADGLVARRFGPREQDLGDYLDIMADYLSFCVAPSLLFYHLYYDVAATPLLTRPEDAMVGLAAGLMAGFGLLRLARHVADGGGLKARFTGLPTTAAGLFATLLVAVGGLGDILTAALIGGAAVLMITEVPYPKIRGRLALPSAALVGAAAAVAVGVVTSGSAATIILLAALAAASAYVFSGLLFMVLRVNLGDVPADEAVAASPPESD